MLESHGGSFRKAWNLFLVQPPNDGPELKKHKQCSTWMPARFRKANSETQPTLYRNKQFLQENGSTFPLGALS